jgi:NAD(P)-dependent dehydrogenase (short-subunit alcohol dehydrogenase family)
MNQNVLITGASSGIGLAIAFRLSQAGYRPLMLSFDEAELEVACGKVPGSQRVLCDLALPEQVSGLLANLEALHGPIDVLINNAGIGHHGPVLDTSDEVFRRLMEVNFLAPVSLCRQALQLMGPRGHGQILNLTSASARRPLARMGAYASSKAALHGFTQTLRMEAAPSGVRVLELLPISVSTPFFERASNTSGSDYRPRGLCQTPEQLAEMTWQCLRSNRPETVSHGPTGWALGLDGLFPNWVARALEWWERRQS